MKKDRIDKILVEQGLAETRSQAQALIMAGQVCLGDQLIKKSSEIFSVESRFRLKDGALTKYVSRGGEKLEGALQESGLDVSNFVALDLGISTGGFTDCLLQSGAAKVYGLDVGHNQLHWKIQKDSRVIAHEGINCRQIPTDLVPEKCDLLVIDVSFISLTYVLPEGIKFLKPGAAVLALIKPQFEVERGQVGKGGIVKDPLLHVQVQEKILKFSQGLNLQVEKVFSSPIEGADGNKEFFIFARRS